MKSDVMKKILFTGILCLLSNVVSAQARLTIENNSQRQMTVKVMRGINKGRLHKKVQIPPYGEEIIYFSKSGQYFCKNKSCIYGEETNMSQRKTF